MVTQRPRLTAVFIPTASFLWVLAPRHNRIFPPLFSTVPLDPTDSSVSFPVALEVEMHPGGGGEEEDGDWVALDTSANPPGPVLPSAPIAVPSCLLVCLPDSPKNHSKHVFFLSIFSPIFFFLQTVIFTL